MNERVEKFTKEPMRVDIGECIKIKDLRGTVAIVTHVHLLGRRNPKHVIANAHLFAAANGLYEALKDMTAAFGKWNVEGSNGCIAKARAALAKARGES